MEKVFGTIPWLLIFLGGPLPSFSFIASSEWKKKHAPLRLSTLHLLSWRHSTHLCLLSSQAVGPLGVSAHGTYISKGFLLTWKTVHSVDCPCSSVPLGLQKHKLREKF